MIVFVSHRSAGLFAEVSADEAKKAAHEILSNPKYRPPESKPRPLSWLGRLEQRVFSAIGRFIGRIVPGAGFVQWLLIGALVVIVAWILARFLTKRSARQRALTAGEPPVSVDSLDAQADAAMARGDYREAVILRFRAGIARLERGPRPAASRLTNGTLGSTIPVSFPSVGLMFDRIRYGDRPAEQENAQQSATEWPKILDEARTHAVTPIDQLAPRKKRTWLRRKP